MKRYILIFLFSATFLLAGIDGSKQLDTKELDKVSISEILKFVSTSISNQLPIVMDEATVLTRVYYYDNSIVYQKTVDKEYSTINNIFLSDDLILEFKKHLYEGDRNTVCYNEFLKYILKRGAIVEYDWVDKKNIPLFDYSVNINDCNEAYEQN